MATNRRVGLLLSTSWPERALLKAQIEEEGTEVIAVDSYDAAMAWLVGGLKVNLLVLDTHNLDPDPTFLRGIAALGLPVLLLTGPFDRPTWDGPLSDVSVVETLVRPTFVGDVAAAVKRLLAA
jgi:hypothetical protein